MTESQVIKPKATREEKKTSGRPVSAAITMKMIFFFRFFVSLHIPPVRNYVPTYANGGSNKKLKIKDLKSECFSFFALAESFENMIFDSRDPRGKLLHAFNVVTFTSAKMMKKR